MASNTVFVILAVFAVLQIGLCLKCFRCSTDKDGSICKGPVSGNDVAVQECAKQETVCMVGVAIVDGQPPIYVRGCTVKPDNTSTQRDAFFASYCYKDLCNSYVPKPSS